MITSILSERQEGIRTALQQVLGELVGVLAELGEASDRERVDEGLAALDSLFRIGVAGGSGADLDGLVAALMPEPVPRLSVAVASPGEAAAWRSGVDLALFVTSASRPLPPSERPILVAASEGAAGLFVVVDGVEMLRLADDVTRMEEAVAQSAERVLGRRPEGAGISTALAAGSPASQESLLPALGSRVVGALRSPAVVRPKLRAPLELAREVAGERRRGLEEDLAALADDLANLAVLEGELVRFDREAEAALREGTAAVEDAVDAYGERAGAFLRRWTRPFPLPLGHRRLEERFREEVLGELLERVGTAAERLEEHLRSVAEAGRAAAVERLESFPTARSRRHPPPRPGPDEEGRAEGREGVAGALDEILSRSLRDGRARLLAGLGRASGLALTLLVLGVLVAVVSLFGTAGIAPSGWGTVLGGGLGAVAVLAAIAVLRFHRRRLTATLAVDLDRLRAGSAAALSAGAQGAAAAGREAIRAPVASYAGAVAEERDRLVEGREALNRLAGDLERLAGRIDTA